MYNVYAPPKSKRKIVEFLHTWSALQVTDKQPKLLVVTIHSACMAQPVWLQLCATS